MGQGPVRISDGGGETQENYTSFTETRLPDDDDNRDSGVTFQADRHTENGEQQSVQNTLWGPGGAQRALVSPRGSFVLHVRRHLCHGADCKHRVFSV